MKTVWIIFEIFYRMMIMFMLYIIVVNVRGIEYSTSQGWIVMGLILVAYYSVVFNPKNDKNK